MFRSSTILKELVQCLAKVTLLLKHSVKLTSYVPPTWPKGHVGGRLLLMSLHNKQHTCYFMTCCHISTQYTMTLILLNVLKEV